jgi:recombination protein RecA
MAMAQRKHKHKRVAWIDMEHVWDPAWAQALGVDLSRVGLFVPDTAEDVADSMKMIVDSGLYSMVTLDSIGGMFAKVEAEKDSGDAVMGKQAQIVTRMVKINAVAAAKNGTVVAMINQVRANLSYGADTTTGGGFALKHATTIKLKMKRTATPPLTVKILGEEIPVAQEIAILVERNKVAPRGRVATVMLKNVATDKYGPVGFDQVDEATNLGIKLGIIGQTGGWYTLPDGQRLNGRERVVEHLRANPQQVDDIRTKVISIRAQEVHVESEQTDEESEAAALKDLQDNVKMPNFRHAENEG